MGDGRRRQERWGAWKESASDNGRAHDEYDRRGRGDRGDQAARATVKMNKDGSMDVSGHLLARERKKTAHYENCEAVSGARHAAQAVCYVDVGRFWRTVL
jgi:hypothetical protein